MPIDFNQLRELLAAIAQTDIAELTLKSEDFELTVRKDVPATSAGASTGEASGSTTVPTPSVMPTKSVVPSNVSPETAASPPIDKRWVEILSPMVGTFYRSPTPDEEPFVEVNDRISAGQTVCIIEAMKLMNEIEAETSGRVMEILVENGEPVEYGQPLMRITPE